MRIATVQYAPVLGDPERSVAAASPLLEVACEEADLVVLPELADTGYDLRTRETAMDLATDISSNLLISALGEICAEKGCHGVAGICERDGDRLYNTAVLMGPGGVVGSYRKLHLFMNEKDIFSPGNKGLPVFDIGHCRVGMLICFDWMFPETWRILSLDGADVVCHPSNLVLPYAQQATLVHALVNRYYVATANRIGAEGDLVFTGGSQVAGPEGKALSSSEANEADVAIVAVDVLRARDKAITPRNDALGDRRPAEYRAIVETSGPGADGTEES